MLIVRIALWSTFGVAVVFVCAFLATDYFTPFPVIVECPQQRADYGHHAEAEKCTSYRSAYFAGHPPIIVGLTDWADANDGAVVGFATIALAVVTALLVGLNRRQLADSRALQRAYISVVPLGIAPFVSGQPYLSCDAGIRNVGKLPAKNVYWWLKTGYSRNRDKTCFPPSERPDGPIVIPPGIEIKKGIGPALSKDEFRKWRYEGMDNGRWLYMWGRVDYTDGFGETRFTEFCHRYNLYAADSSFRISPEHARFHQHHNQTDED